MKEFISLYSLFFLTLVSPGPDFAVTVKNSLVSRKAGVFTALGIATGIVFHLTYIIVGVAVMIQSSTMLFSIIRYAGALYLIWMGVSLLRSHPTDPTLEQDKQEQKHKTFFKDGLIVNLLNPKATFFLLSLFSQVVSPNTTKATLTFYGLSMVVTTFAWFSLVTLFLSSPLMQKKFRSYEQIFNKTMGSILILFGLKMLWSGVNFV